MPSHLWWLTNSINDVNWLLTHETKCVPDDAVELFVLNFDFSWLDKSMAFTGRSLRILGPGGWQALMLELRCLVSKSCSIAAMFWIACSCCISVTSVLLGFDCLCWGFGRSRYPGCASLLVGHVLTIDGKQHEAVESWTCLFVSWRLCPYQRVLVWQRKTCLYNFGTMFVHQVFDSVL